MADQIVQRLRQTTDPDILDIENIIGLGGDQAATQRIALHQLIQTRRLADATERQAAALERIAGCVGSPLTGPSGPNEDGVNPGYFFLAGSVY